jgi:hypothetical protein
MSDGPINFDIENIQEEQRNLVPSEGKYNQDTNFFSSDAFSLFICIAILVIILVLVL